MGNPSTFNWNDSQNGLAVHGAEGSGVYIGRADQYGVYVWSAGMTSVYANTTESYGEWGIYTPDKIKADNLTTNSLSVIAIVGGTEPLSPGELVAAVGLSEPLTGSGGQVPEVRRADQDNYNGIVGVVESKMVYIPGPEGEGDGAAMELHRDQGLAQPGDFVALTIYGITQVRVNDALAANIQPGMRLTASIVPGAVRTLRIESLNGMMVTEGAPILGIALAAWNPGSDTVPVLVTLR